MPIDAWFARVITNAVRSEFGAALKKKRGEFMQEEDAVDLFAAEMKSVLDLNRRHGKKGWNNINPRVCIGRILEEFAEYFTAMSDEHKSKEIIDVANFCMMLWFHHTKKVRANSPEKVAP